MFSDSIPGYLFVWRGEWVQDQTAYREICPYCKIRTHVDTRGFTKERDGVDREENDSTCLLCGWTSSMNFADLCTTSTSTIRAFDMNSLEVGLGELATHLKTHFRDIYSIDPRRFEQLVGDIFADHSYSTFLTKISHDRGVDVLMVNRKTGAVDAVIQCKRYAAHRAVDIGAVQRLAGVAIEWGTRRAYLVTTSRFSRFAESSAERLAEQGIIELELLEASDVLKLLQVYNVALPPIHLLSEEARAEIIRANGRRLGRSP